MSREEADEALGGKEHAEEAGETTACGGWPHRPHAERAELGSHH